jgi:hypothetical protein
MSQMPNTSISFVIIAVDKVIPGKDSNSVSLSDAARIRNPLSFSRVELAGLGE